MICLVILVALFVVGLAVLAGLSGALVTVVGLFFALMVGCVVVGLVIGLARRS